VHPEDLIVLHQAGFTREGTDKRYKWYINAPDGSGPVPPIKLYANHLNADLAARLNAVIEKT
jgi:hypothetical protein